MLLVPGASKLDTNRALQPTLLLSNPFWGLAERIDSGTGPALEACVRR